jgi:hypothetical protein
MRSMVFALMGVIAAAHQARSQGYPSPETDPFNDPHFHLTNYIQEGGYNTNGGYFGDFAEKDPV